MPQVDKILANHIGTTRAAKLLGTSRTILYERIARGDFALDERGRILREPFMAMIATRIGETSDAE